MLRDFQSACTVLLGGKGTTLIGPILIDLCKIVAMGSTILIGAIGRYLSYLWLLLFSSISGKGGGKKGKDMLKGNI